tara:strand:- start:2534 stop:2701 length:168 start_codon:yes stop_codon:yes gene_type:complete
MKATKNQLIELTVEFKNGKRYCYSGATKKEATKKYLDKFGNFKGILKKEWEIIED